MAVVIEEYEIDGDNAVAASLTNNFASQPNSGNQWLVMGGVYFADGTDDISITAPASTTQRITPGTGGNINMVAAEKSSSGSDGTASTVTKSGTNRSLGIFAANISGAVYDTTAGSAKDGPTSSVTSRTTTSSGNVSADNSLAIHTTFMRRVGTYTYSFTNSTTELASIVAATSNQLSVHVGTKTVSSGATATTGFQMDTGTATNLVAGQVIYNPDNSAPTVTVPATHRATIGVAEVLSGLSVTDPDV